MYKSNEQNTDNFYSKNAADYFHKTKNLDLSHLYEPFLSLIPEGGKILDAGCGSGRDSLFFKKRGYDLVSFDNSAELANLASKYIGREVLNMSFSDVNFLEEFDGIWACASLLHVSKKKMPSVITKLLNALKPNGILYCSFKHGKGEKIITGRLFNYYDEVSFQKLVSKHGNSELLKMWETVDVRPDRNEIWLNALIKKSEC